MFPVLHHPWSSCHTGHAHTTVYDKPVWLRLQILMASDPLWATLFAGVLGAAEQDLGPAGWAGGALIIAVKYQVPLRA